MKLVSRSFEEYSNVSVSFFMVEDSVTQSKKEKILVVAFASESNVSREDTFFMDAMKVAAAKIWSPDAIVFDFQKLKYEWGDTFAFLFQNPYPAPNTPLQRIFEGDNPRHCPIVAVISDLNREGLCSLIEKEMQKEPGKLLFNTIEGAIAAIEGGL